MCFALFGRTSGAERDGRQMRSDYVDPATVTEVVFDFALGAEVYRVRRAPEQEVLKKRGTGTTKLPAAATLWKRTGLAPEDEGTVAASDWKRVTEVLEGLLGFRYEQFRQVVVLPQGEFRRLLLAKSGEREEILATLFRTEKYRRIEEFFKQAARGVEEAARELGARRDWLLQEAGAASVEELTVRLAGNTARSLKLTADALAARNALQSAQERLAAAIHLAPSDPEPRLHLVQLLERAGRPKEAFWACEAAMGLFPGDAELLKLAARLRRKASIGSGSSGPSSSSSSSVPPEAGA
jgi:exonuclease SbcC